MKYTAMTQCKNKEGKTGCFLKCGDWEGTLYKDLVELFNSNLYKELKANNEIKYL